MLVLVCEGEAPAVLGKVPGSSTVVDAERYVGTSLPFQAPWRRNSPGNLSNSTALFSTASGSLFVCEIEYKL